MSNFPAVFGGVIAYILLVLYVATVGYMTYMVAEYKVGEFSQGVTYVVTTVGGLVSALVIARLAVAVPGNKPTLVPSAAQAAGEQPGTLSDVLTAAYLIVWLLTGLAALVVGVMLYSDVNRSLAGIGSTWLGLAVAAGYAYFGLQPPSGSPGVVAVRDEQKITTTEKDGSKTTVEHNREAVATQPTPEKKPDGE